MNKLSRFITAACGLSLMGGSLAGAHDQHESKVKHVLLVSIDGMHALDLQNCVAANTCPNLAGLAKSGVVFPRTSTAKPSDSFPGMMSIVTGGSPKLLGVYYDVAYDRVLAPPAADTGNGVLHGDCTPGQANGTRTEYEEGIDHDQTMLNGGGPYSATDGGYRSIDSKKLPRDPYAGCAAVYPWNFVRANTVFGVVHGSGGYTAWSDKHAAYASVSGPTGSGIPSNLDDFYSPEVNSTRVPLPGVKTATGLDCGHMQNNNGGDWTTDFDGIKCYDQLKVNAVLNWIRGKTRLGDHEAPVPAIFGMNFQAVSVGQKLIEGTVKGGYSDGTGTPSASLEGEITFVDAAIGQWISELQNTHRLRDTAIIVTAKHGQSPIDPNRFFPIPGHAGTNGSAPSTILGATYLPDSEINQIGPTEDDISLLWLKPGANADAAVDLLETNAKAAGIGELLYGSYLEMIFGKPGLPKQGGDPRTPDIVVVPNVGVIYTGSLKKQAEHGGFAQDDTNVLMLVSNPNLEPRTVTSFVETAQVAPTILNLLGYEVSALDAVRKEGTPVLPGLSFRE